MTSHDKTSHDKTRRGATTAGLSAEKCATPHADVLIMGGDNLGTLQKWKNYEQILRGYDIYVYKRPQYEIGEFATHPRVSLFDAPLMDISATYIRKCLIDGKSIQYLVPDSVMQYLMESKVYT